MKRNPSALNDEAVCSPVKTLAELSSPQHVPGWWDPHMSPRQARACGGAFIGEMKPEMARSGARVQGKTAHHSLTSVSMEAITLSSLKYSK